MSDWQACICRNYDDVVLSGLSTIWAIGVTKIFQNYH